MHNSALGRRVTLLSLTGSGRVAERSPARLRLSWDTTVMRIETLEAAMVVALDAVTDVLRFDTERSAEFPKPLVEIGAAGGCHQGSHGVSLGHSGVSEILVASAALLSVRVRGDPSLAVALANASRPHIRVTTWWAWSPPKWRLLRGAGPSAAPFPRGRRASGLPLQSRGPSPGANTS